jgi:hypothetical protein
VLQRWIVGRKKLLGSGVEDLHWCLRIEGDVLDCVAFSSTGLEDAVLQIDRRLAGNVVGVDGHISLRTSILHPMNRAVVVPFGASYPGIAMLVVNPSARMADGPIIRSAVHVEVSAKHLLLAGQGVPSNQATNTVRGAGERIVLGSQDCAWTERLTRLRDSQKNWSRLS